MADENKEFIDSNIPEGIGFRSPLALLFDNDEEIIPEQRKESYKHQLGRVGRTLGWLIGTNNYCDFRFFGLPLPKIEDDEEGITDHHRYFVNQAQESIIKFKENYKGETAPKIAGRINYVFELINHKFDLQNWFAEIDSKIPRAKAPSLDQCIQKAREKNQKRGKTLKDYKASKSVNNFNFGHPKDW